MPPNNASSITGKARPKKSGGKLRVIRRASKASTLPNIAAPHIVVPYQREVDVLQGRGGHATGGVPATRPGVPADESGRRLLRDEPAAHEHRDPVAQVFHLVHIV